MKIVTFKKPLPLKNDGNLEIVFIGVGSAFSTKLYNNNLLLIKGDTHILVDFGFTGPFALPKTTGLKIPDIGVLLPTHSHTDHIGGIEYLALYDRYISGKMKGGQKLKMIISGEYKEILWNLSLRGGMEWNETNNFGDRLELTDYFDVIRPKYIEHEPRLRMELQFNDIHLELFGTNHIPDNAISPTQAFFSLGLFVDGRVFISGDTKFDRPLLDHYASRSEILFHDTSFMPNPVHASIEELRKLPKKIKEKMYLMHYGDNFEDVDISGFAGLVKLGYKYIFPQR